MEINKQYKGKAIGPINIALIKYWGKENEEFLIPLNNSISLTLDSSTFYTETEVIIFLNNKNEDEIILKINNEIFKVNERIKNIIKLFKEIKGINKTGLNIEINSKNTFPIASGCASSASSMSALTKAFEKAFELNLNSKELSKIARLGSGSACRSIISGISEWIKYGENKESYAVQLYDKNYWNLQIKLIIISHSQKEISSSVGMKLTKETSELFKYRISHIVNENIKKLKESLKNKNFQEFAEIIIKDSNNFHACCRDTYPTINYLNESSEYIIKCVNFINKLFGHNICAYTFDAGSNAFLIYEEINKNFVDKYFSLILSDNKNNFIECIKEIKKDSLDIINEGIKLFDMKKDNKQIKQQINFCLGEGAY